MSTVTHKDLNVWNKAMSLVETTYRVTQTFPKEEIYSLTNQIHRCVVSIPSNIAEGAARGSKKEYIRFLDISLGSLSELETLFEISIRLGYMKANSASDSLVEIRKMLLNLIKYLKTKIV